MRSSSQLRSRLQMTKSNSLRMNKRAKTCKKTGRHHMRYTHIYTNTFNKQIYLVFNVLHIFFVINNFLFFHTQHNIISKIQKQTNKKNRQILNISRSNQKGGGEGRTTRTQKSLLYTILYTYVQQKTLPSINGRRPGPTNSRRCTFTSHYLQEATDPICFSTHVWCKPVLDYCLLRSCKTSKQHSLLHQTNRDQNHH